MSVEIWKAVKDYEGIYEISSYGRLRSLDRAVRHYSGGDRNVKGKLYEPHYLRGYILYGLCKNGKIKTGYAARLVAIAFIPNPENKPEVNHKNGIKTDNRIENLEWLREKKICNTHIKINYGKCQRENTLKNLERQLKKNAVK